MAQKLTWDKNKREWVSDEEVETSRREQPQTTVNRRSFDELYNEYRSNRKRSYIQSFFEDADKYFSSAERDYGGLTFGNSRKTSEARKAAMEDLFGRREWVSAFLREDPSLVSEESMPDIMRYLDGFDMNARKVQDSFDRISRLHNQFASENDYDTAVRYNGYFNKYDGMSIEDIGTTLAGMANGEEKDWLAKYKKSKENEAYLSELTGGYDPAKHQQEGRDGWNDYVATQERYKQQAADAKKAQEDKGTEDYSWEQFWRDLGRWMGPGVNPDTSLPFHVDVNLASKEYQEKDAALRNPDERWSDEQKQIFGYLWNTKRQRAYEYAFAVNNMLNAQEEEKQISKIQDVATDNFFAGAGNTLGAIAAAPLGLADYLGDLIQLGAVGYVSPGDGEITPFEYSQAVTGGISKHLNDAGGTLNENIPIIGGKGWGDVYGLGTSIVQSAAAVYSGGSAQALITFFGSASASGVDDAISRGATGEQALLYGTSVGAAEALAEMIGIDNLMNIGSSATVKQLLWNLLKQGGAEGLEEGVTAFLGNVADNVIMGDKSNFYRRVEDLRYAGLSEEAAKKKAWVEMWGDVAYDMLGGFVSGGIHAGPQTAYHTFMQNSNIKNTYGGSQQDLVGEALEIDPDNAYAQRMQGRLDAGKNLSGSQLNQLVQQNESALTAQDMANIQGAAESRLSELGETGDVSAIAAVLAKQAAGQKITRAEKNVLDNSRYGQRVANELNANNIRSGEYASAWAENIGTERINPQEYSRLIETAQQTQETVETAVGQVVTDKHKAAQIPQAEPGAAAEAPVATISEKETVPANDQQVTGKLTGKESLPVAEESSGSEVPKSKTVTLEDASKKYGAQAQAMIHTYQQGQDVERYDKGYQAAYDMGMSGVNFSYVEKSPSVSYLTDSQKQLAYEAGQAAAEGSTVLNETGKTVKVKAIASLFPPRSLFSPKPKAT